MVNLSNNESIRDYGFEGFKTVASLRANVIEEVPSEKGVYMVVAPNSFVCQFMERSTGGFFKKRNPSVPVSKLYSKWVPKALVLYIGKAGSPDGNATLRKRITGFIGFGNGKPIGHWGGRYIWQLRDAEQLLICWRVFPGAIPREVKKSLISSFEAKYGCLPFANLQH